MALSTDFCRNYLSGKGAKCAFTGCQRKHEVPENYICATCKGVGTHITKFCDDYHKQCLITLDSKFAGFAKPGNDKQDQSLLTKNRFAASYSKMTAELLIYNDGPINTPMSFCMRPASGDCDWCGSMKDISSVSVINYNAGFMWCPSCRGYYILSATDWVKNNHWPVLFSESDTSLAMDAHFRRKRTGLLTKIENIHGNAVLLHDTISINLSFNVGSDTMYKVVPLRNILQNSPSIVIYLSTILKMNHLEFQAYLKTLSSSALNQIFVEPALPDDTYHALMGRIAGAIKESQESTIFND